VATAGVGVAAAAAFAAGAAAGPPLFAQSATTIDDVLALDRPVVLAHTGGEDEFPGSTMYAFARSMEAGVDVLDLNVVLTADGVLAVQHDLDVDRQTNGTGSVGAMTFAALHELDNAYWFTGTCGVCHDEPAESYRYRGMRTGVVPSPQGYAPDDFAIPRLDELMDAFPDIPLGIEIKAEGADGRATADALVDLLEARGRIDHVVVSSFSDDVIAYVEAIAPDLEVSPGPGPIGAFLLEGTPLPDGQRILQLPPEFADVPLLTPDYIAAAHEAGYVIWVWPDDHDLENQDAYRDFLVDGIDGLNINYPAAGVAAVAEFVTTACPRAARATRWG